MKHTVKTKFIFPGTFSVEANTPEEAAELVKNHCHLSMGSGVHTDPLENDIDWEFNTHAEIIVSKCND